MTHTEENQHEELTETNQDTSAENAESSAESTSPEGHWPEDEAIASLDAQLAEEKEKYLRLYSDFDNFKKRSARERMEFLMTAGKDVILSMLPVLDDMERALKATENLEGEAKVAREGFELIYKKMLNTLEARGLKAMNSVGTPFDVELHEAVTKIPAPSDELKGKVVDELEKGYLLNDKVIRFTKVIVGE